MLSIVSESSPETPEEWRRRTEKIQHTARVAPFVVVPGDKLDEVIVESNASLHIEDGRVRVTNQIGGDNLILSVRKNTYDLVSAMCAEGCRVIEERTLERRLGGLLEDLLDFVVAGRLVKDAGEIHDGDVGCRNTH